MWSPLLGPCAALHECPTRAHAPPKPTGARNPLPCRVFVPPPSTSCRVLPPGDPPGSTRQMHPDVASARRHFWADGTGQGGSHDYPSWLPKGADGCKTCRTRCHQIPADPSMAPRPSGPLSSQEDVSKRRTRGMFADSSGLAAGVVTCGATDSWSHPGRTDPGLPPCNHGVHGICGIRRCGHVRFLG